MPARSRLVKEAGSAGTGGVISEDFASLSPLKNVDAIEWTDSRALAFAEFCLFKLDLVATELERDTSAPPPCIKSFQGIWPMDDLLSRAEAWSNEADSVAHNSPFEVAIELG